MSDAKYIGLDVHQATVSAAVLDSAGKLLMESTFETKAATILQFFHGLRGRVQVTFEEGTCAAWLHDLVKPHVRKVVVCGAETSVVAFVTAKPTDNGRTSPVRNHTRLHAGEAVSTVGER